MILILQLWILVKYIIIIFFFDRILFFLILILELYVDKSTVYSKFISNSSFSLLLPTSSSPKVSINQIKNGVAVYFFDNGLKNNFQNKLNIILLIFIIYKKV
jgi:hypothetical protein